MYSDYGYSAPSTANVGFTFSYDKTIAIRNDIIQRIDIIHGFNSCEYQIQINGNTFVKIEEACPENIIMNIRDKLLENLRFNMSSNIYLNKIVGDEFGKTEIDFNRE